MITVLLHPEDLAGDADRVVVEGAPYRHLFRARRLEAGARLRVVDGRGRARWAVVDRVERRLAVLSLEAPAPDNEPDYRLHLWVAALRAERASWLVEKATEIGVRSIRFIATERTPRKYAPASLDRLRRVARAAVEQSHRSRVPEIAGVEAWEAVTANLRNVFRESPSGGTLSEAGDRYVLDLAAPVAPKGHQRNKSPEGGQTEPSGSWCARGDSGIVLVGPEGGWSRAEAGELERLGCEGVSLGPRTLRVETAAIAAAARLLL